MTKTELKNKLDKTLEYLKSEMSQIRTGRANPSLIEDVRVEAYGSNMTLKELGSISLLDSQTLVVSPWDRGLVGTIAKAIRNSDLNLNPVDDTDKIRIPVPSLTEERRKELAKVVSTKVEEAKNSMRSVRQDAMKDIEKDFADKAIGEDDKFRLKEEVEETVKDFVQQADDLGENKKEDLMKI